MNKQKTSKNKLKKPLLDKLAKLALAEAKLAYDKGEVPVGAIISRGEEIIAKSHNLIESNKDATAHAEILAIKSASKVLDDWRLTDCVLTVTLEPCTMCLGAIKQSRLSGVVFLAYDPERGACGSLYDLSADKRLGPNPEVIYELNSEPSINLLKKFFQEKRNKISRQTS